MAAEQTITRWSCPSEHCTTFGRVFGGPCSPALRASGECVAVERTYVAADTLREWIHDERIAVSPGTVWGQGYCRAIDNLSALLDDLTTGGGKTDG